MAWLYLVGAVLLWPVFAAQIAHHDRKQFRSVWGFDDYLFSAFFGFFAAAVWPLAVLFFGMARLVKHMVEAAEVEERR